MRNFPGAPVNHPGKFALTATDERGAPGKMRNFPGAPVESGARTHAGSGQAWMDHERPNFFSGPYIERRAEEREDPDWIGAARADPATRYLISQGTRQLLRGRARAARRLPRQRRAAGMRGSPCAAGTARLVRRRTLRAGRPAGGRPAARAGGHAVRGAAAAHRACCRRRRGGAARLRARTRHLAHPRAPLRRVRRCDRAPPTPGTA